jgi:uncharacterized protein YbaP (TraB family)
MGVDILSALRISFEVSCFKKGITTMPKKKKPAKTMSPEHLKKVEKMGKDLELKLKEVRKHMEKMMDWWEHGPQAYKRRRRP